MQSFSLYLTRAKLFLQGKPQVSAEFRDLVGEACEWTSNRQDALKRVFEIGTYERFDWYQEKGIIVFSTAGSPRVVADIQFAGSISRLTRSWLWAWNNDSFLEPVARASEHVRHEGESAGYLRLTQAQWHADETDGWEMTSIQALWTGAEGVYRTPSGPSGSTFMTLSNVRWAAQDQWYEPAERVAPE